MTFPRLLAIVACVLFAGIGVAAFFKDGKNVPTQLEMVDDVPLEIELDHEILMASGRAHEIVPENAIEQQLPIEISPVIERRSDSELPEADRIAELFNKKEPKLPIVQTVTYASRVAWQKGRPAWLSDYAAHYGTSRHFIARSLNGKADYFKQNVAEGDRFNVFHPDKNINFYLVIDTSRSKLWFYYHDLGTNETVLLKTYKVGLGRFDSSKPSGMLTPLGKYSVGSKIAIYKPKVTGFHNGKKTEMIRIFGTRWIPFDKELGDCTAPSGGFGISGVPWTPGANGELVENIDSLGKYESDGCIRLSTADMEELFAIIITKPTTVELVKDFFEAKVPGVIKKSS